MNAEQCLAKSIDINGDVIGYDRARRFDIFERPVGNVAQIADLLRELLHRPDCAVVRGAVIDPMRTRGVRRLLHPDPETGDAPILRDVPRRWVALDVEGIEIPADLAADDLIGCAHLALSKLPLPFSGTQCVVQASGSHGLKPDLRLRLWFWCSRPLSGTELKLWCEGTPADPSVFGAAQLIYTAAPVLLAGAVDLLPRRLVELPGRAVVDVPSPEALQRPVVATPTAPRPIYGSDGARRYVRGALVRAAHRILTAEKRHPAIIAECCKLARLVHSGLLPEADLRAVVVRAAKTAGKDDLSEMAACIAWGLAHASEGKVPEVCRG